jgi:hypothetical protein
MLTFASPWLFGMAVAASLVVAGLHLLSVRRPPPLMLPTARFVPDGEARAVARQPRLNDVLLLLLRIAAVLAAGAALAGARWQNTTASELRLVVADEALRADTVWRDSVTRALAGDDALVDVRFARGMSRDVGAALVAAIGRAGQITTTHRAISRVDLTVVLPVRTASRAGFDAWRSQWPGRVRVVLRGSPELVPVDTTAADVRVVGGVRDDIVEAALGRSLADAPRRVLIERGNAARAAVAAERTVSTIVVSWPTNGAPDGWEPRSVQDTVGALVANGEVLVGPFVRTTSPTRALQARIDSGSAMLAPVRVIAWWSDGAPAAVEQATAGGNGCARSVSVVLPAAGDLLLSNEARGFRRALTAPCEAGSVPSSVLMNDGGRGDSLAPATAFRITDSRQNRSDPWWLTPALLALATMLLLGEWWWLSGEGPL